MEIIPEQKGGGGLRLVALVEELSIHCFSENKYLTTKTAYIFVSCISNRQSAVALRSEMQQTADRCYKKSIHSSV